jgi:multiple antibiotic resistance protein
MVEYTVYTKMLIGLIAIVNPIGAIPIILQITPGASNRERKRITKIIVLSVFFILMVSLFVGEILLGFFGISINSFRVGGGILILLMAVSMLQGHVSQVKQTPEEAKEGESLRSVAVVPLSMPLLAGPGAISTVILYGHQGKDVVHYFLVGLVILLLAVILWVIFQFIPWISRHITRTGMNVFSRIMGLILAAIAIEFIADGVKGLFPIFR